jgi:glutathione synthase/RimK-type ligase-like ATP-grasp enzyme
VARQIDIALATATEMPLPDPESGLLVEALAEIGVVAEMVAWDQPRDWSEFGLVMSRTPWDYFHRHAEFVEWIGAVDAVTRIENPAAVLVWNSHKAYMLDLEVQGIPIVPTTLLRVGAGEPEQAAALASGGEVVIKPAVSGGALETLRAGAGSREAAVHLSELVARKDALVQPFAPAVTTSGETSLVYFDGVLSHAVRKRAAPGDFRIHREYGGTVEPHVAHREERAVAEAVFAAAPARTSYARIDFVESAGGPALMEAEMIEPELFLPVDPESAGRLARCLAGRLGSVL